jgi:hypothetical protein
VGEAPKHPGLVGGRASVLRVAVTCHTLGLVPSFFFSPMRELRFPRNYGIGCVCEGDADSRPPMRIILPGEIPMPWGFMGSCDPISVPHGSWSSPLRAGSL